MKAPSLLLILCALLWTSCTQTLRLPKDVTWDEKTGKFAWWGGEIRVPAGFTYQVDQGADTFQGHFRSPDGRLVIHHDIGGYAGEYASAKGASSFEEWRIEGARVWTARKPRSDGNGGSTTLVAVTFPDAERITQIAQSYRPPKKPTQEILP